MSAEWMTYKQVAEKLGIKPHSARMRAKRNQWQTRTRNDTGATEVLIDLDELRPSKKGAHTKASREADTPANSDLKAHIADLQTQLEIKDQQISDLQANLSKTIDALSHERKGLFSRIFR